MGIEARNWAIGFVSVSTWIVVAILTWRFLRHLHRRSAEIKELMGAHRARESLLDDEFIRRGDFSMEESAYAIGIRNVLGDMMQVPRTTVYPQDTMGYVERFFLDGMDTVEFVMALEEELAAGIPDKIGAQLFPFRGYEEMTLRDMATLLSRHRERGIPQ